jgi:hypothetical protein
LNAEASRQHTGSIEPQPTEKETIMKPTGMKRMECGICFYQSKARQFTPITVSADFRALECPKCLNNDPDYFTEVEAVEVAQKKAA